MQRVSPYLAAVFLALVFAGGSTFAQEALPKSVPTPKDNPSSKEKIELGKQLFFDPRISQSGTISCNSCHNVMAGGDDSRSVSLGFKAQTGARNAPTVWNAAFKSVQFWDGRAASLEEQAKGPMINPVEMGMPNHSVVIERIKKIPDYEKEFHTVFADTDPVTIDNVAKAIATFERTLITRNSRFDRYERGQKSAMSKLEISGFETFKTTGCVACHSGANFSGPPLPIGTAFLQKFPTYPDQTLETEYGFSKDLGRAQVTKNKADEHLFVVQSLRNIELTAPYFHNGRVKTLPEAVRVMAKLQLNKDLSEDDDKKIVAFLKTLTGDFPSIVAPRLPVTSGSTLLTE